MVRAKHLRLWGGPTFSSETSNRMARTCETLAASLNAMRTYFRHRMAACSARFGNRLIYIQLFNMCFSVTTSSFQIIPR